VVLEHLEHQNSLILEILERLESNIERSV